MLSNTNVPEGRYAMVLINEIGDKRSITCFERMSDYYEYLEINKNMSDEPEMMYQKEQSH